MPGYIRDEINFHGFMTMMRQMHKVTLEQVCDGLCSVSMMKRIESGQRLPDKLTRDRIMQRLGVTLEGYEDYLTPEEYEEWRLRQKIIKCLDKKDAGHAKKYLDEYSSGKERSKVELQFYEAMNYMLLKLENAATDLQIKTIERAVKLTMPKLSPKHLGSILLSEQELNLLVEYLWLYAQKEDAEERIGLCIQRYEDILSYISNSLMDATGRAKTYPQAAYYLCRLILGNADTRENIQKGMKICHQAIEILRNAKKAYFFIELLEVWQELAHRRLLKLQGEGRDNAAESLRVENGKKKEWEILLKELYQEYEVPMYMENFSYLYQETRSYCISDVIRTRRQMLGMTKEQLSEGICSVKTLTRIELKKAKTQMPIVRELFGRLGLYVEYTRERVITNDYEALKLADRLARYINMENTIEGVRPVIYGNAYCQQGEFPVCAHIKIKSSCWTVHINRFIVERVNNKSDLYYTLAEPLTIYEYDEYGQKFAIVSLEAYQKCILSFDFSKSMRERYTVKDIFDLNKEDVAKIYDKYLVKTQWCHNTNQWLESKIG